MPTSRFCCVVLSLAAVFCASARGQVSPTKTPAPKIDKPVWTPQLEDNIGLSRDNFVEMGLSKLTVQESAKLYIWAYSRTIVAAEKAKEEAAATQATYSCGPSKANLQALDKVNILIEGAEKAPDELMSGLRQKLRAISDVQIVFTNEEADLVVKITAFETHLDNSDRRIGYTASTTVATPCAWKHGTFTGRFLMWQNGSLTTASKVEVVIDDIIAMVDSQEIETVRKQNASWKKILQQGTK